MEQKRPENIQEARKLARRRRRRRLMIIRTAIVLAVVLLLVLVGALVVLKIVGTQQSKRGETTGFLAVKEILVEGETRYTPEEIIEKSGLYVGQSLMGVNKVRAHDRLLQEFPYLDTVQISNASFDTLRIRLTETKVMAAVQVTEGWMIVGENNHAMESLTEDTLPKGVLKVVGATLENETIGQSLLDERSLRICRNLVASASLYNLQGMTTIDMTEKTNLSILLNEQITVLLGTETNVATQVQMLVDTLPMFYENNGTAVAGRMDMTTYADSDPDNDKVIFTPQELIDNPPVVTPETSEDADTSGTEDSSAPEESSTPEESSSAAE